MRRLPTLSPKAVISALERAGFVVARVSGSHYVLVHPDDARRRTVEPFHASRDLPKGTLRSIVTQAGLTVEEFLALL